MISRARLVCAGAGCDVLHHPRFSTSVFHGGNGRRVGRRIFSFLGQRMKLLVIKCKAVLFTIVLLLLSQGAKADGRAPAVCAPGAVLDEITFTVRKTNPERTKNGSTTSPYIHLADPAADLAHLEDAAAIVLPCREIIVVVDYPVDGEFEFKLTPDAPTGFARAEIAQKISMLYQEIYSREERTTKTPVIPREKRTGLINRNTTDGEYGIWGHDLDDLDLSGISPEVRDGKVYVTLEIDS